MTNESNLALFCDFENIALGVRDEKSAKLDIRLILERLLLKGSIVAKKAYCDWDRYKDFKTQMHAAAFELIEIPHVRQSGKNSADIRMVVDALDLCYTKAHIDTFVVISGDSDFSPLVSKLRENAKTVIGIGVRNSTSDLLVTSCDEFIFYDDLIPLPVKSPARSGSASGRRRSKPSGVRNDALQQGIGLVLETAEALYAERGDRAKLWGSMIKQTLQRRRPDFSEATFGCRSFNDLLEEAENRGQLELERDEKSGGYVIRKISRPA